PGADGCFGVYLQVIVMSSHETIRVLEVGVDAPLPAEEDRKAVEMPPGEVARGSPGATGPPGREDVPPSTQSSGSGETAGKTPSFPGTHSLGCPCSLHPCKRIMVPAGTVTQPLLIPISIAGQVAGQQGLAVWTFPTATVAALPGLTAASPTGGIFKPPIANLQAAAVLNTAIQAPVQPAQPLQAAVQPRAPLQPPGVFPAAPGQPPILPQPPAAPTPPVAKPLETQTQITVQPAGFAFNPGIISAASLGGQTQLLGSLAAAPVIANTISSVQGITGQILTNAQGQVIGTLPWVVNPPGMAASPVPAALPAQNLQVQTVTPQLLLNAQGQVIATLAGSAIPAAAIKKTGTPEPPTKNEVSNGHGAGGRVAKGLAMSPAVEESGRKGGKWEKRRKVGEKEGGCGRCPRSPSPRHRSLPWSPCPQPRRGVPPCCPPPSSPASLSFSGRRFEKLDITPKSAQKLKPVLEKWLSEAELRNQEGQQNLMEFVGGEPSKKRKRRTSFTPQAIEALNAYFEKNALPTGQEITEIAKELNYDREVVRVWFCNRRQTLKNTSKLNVFQIP
ncbi:PO6F1 factor, partial [Uria aalge]|nr:PO6F1 factor [Uria aalge]